MNLISFDDRDGVIWFDGALVQWRDAKVHVLSHGLHYGSCVFEGERIYNGRVFRLSEHSQRLIDSAQILGFKIPYTVEELVQATHKVVAAQGIVDGYVRPIAWRGSEEIEIYAPHSKIHVAIATWQWPTIFGQHKRTEGIRLKLSHWVRPAPNMAPVHSKAAGLYTICSLGRIDAVQGGYDDALMLDYRGYVAEATAANLFFMRDGKLHTPIPDCFLNGLTRQTVIDLAKKHGLEVIEGHFLSEDLQRAEEVFLTGTAYEVQPVSAIEDQLYVVGPITQLLMKIFGEHVRAP